MVYGNTVLVQTGDIEKGGWRLYESGLLKGYERIFLDQFHQCSIVSDRHESQQSGVGRVAGGIIGAALLGPIGAIGGLMSGGKKRIDETIILCKLDNGKTFSAECTPLTAAKLIQICSSNNAQKQSNTTVAINEVSKSPEILSESDSRECPMCAETIKAKAKLCRFCGYRIEDDSEKVFKSLKNDPDNEIVLVLNEQINICNKKQNPKYAKQYLKTDVIKMMKACIENDYFNPSGLGSMMLKASRHANLEIDPIHFKNWLSHGFDFFLKESRGNILIINDEFIVKKKVSKS